VPAPSSRSKRTSPRPTASTHSTRSPTRSSGSPKENALRRVADAAAVAADVAAFIVLTGIPARTGWKYGERGYRHVWWDAGTMLANLLAAADGLEPRLYTGFIDDRLNDILRVVGTSEVALAALAVGAASAALPPAPESRQTGRPSIDRRRARFPLADAAHAAGKLRDAKAVHAWRVDREGEEPRLEREALRSGAVNIFQLANLDTVRHLLGERGYRWAQLEAGIRAGRLQVGAYVRGWGAAASTFYDDDVSRFLGTEDAPMLMVAIGARA
jgi:nitroreductase